MSVFKKGKNYYIDYYVNGRRKREKVGPNKRQALIVLQKRKVQVVERKFLDIQRHEKIKFEDMAKTYIEAYSKPNKRSFRRDEISLKNLTGFFKGKYLHEIISLHIEKYRVKRLRVVTPATVNRELACLKHMFNKAKEWGKASENPALKIKLLKEENRRTRYLETEEIKALVNACPDHLRPIVITALNTGMRKGEILNLKWPDVDLRQKIIYIYNSKSGKSRKVDINDWLVETFIRVRKHPESPYVFCNKDGKPYGNIRKSFDNAKRRAGIKDFRFHDLRHTFASHLVMAGIDLKTVQELLGHQTYEMTLRYSHLSPDHRRRAVNIFCRRMDTIWTPKEKREKSTEKFISEDFDQISILDDEGPIAQSVEQRTHNP